MAVTKMTKTETYINNGHHRRRLERRVLSQTVLVTDVLTTQKVGEVVNITTEGIMILADTQLVCNSVFMFELILPECIDGKQSIRIGVDCLWCKGSDNFDRFWTGFQIIDADSNTTKLIENLIDNFG